MQFTVRLYYNTGFNAVNVPENGALLDTLVRNGEITCKDFEGYVDLNQSYFLDEIRVKAKESDVCEADYLRLNPVNGALTGAKVAYYSITDYDCTSPDVTVLNVVMDSFVTAGGRAIKFLDGMTRRHHVPANHDDPFKNPDTDIYAEDDELLVPSKPLRILFGVNSVLGENSIAFGNPEHGYNVAPANVYGVAYPNESALMGAHKFFVKATVQIATSDLAYYMKEQNLLTVITDNSGDHSVQYPNMEEWATTFMRNTELTLANGNFANSGGYGGELTPNEYKYKDPASGYFDLSDEMVKKNIAFLRSCGLEDSIVDSYYVPKVMTNSYTLNTSSGSQIKVEDQVKTGLVTDTGPKPGMVEKIESTFQIVELKAHSDGSPFAFKQGDINGTKYKNKRVLYGKYRKYGLKAVASNETLEINPESLMGDFQTEDGTKFALENPIMLKWIDPRSNGKPYFNLYRTDINDQASKYGIYIGSTGAISGLTWNKNPIVHTTASGALMDQVNTAMSNAYAFEDYEYAKEYGHESGYQKSAGNIISTLAAKGLSGAAGASEKAQASTLAGGIHGSGETFVGTAGQNLTYDVLKHAGWGQYLMRQFGNKYQKADDERNKAIARELQALDVRTSVFSPTVRFPVSEGIREASGNGVLPYRYTPCDEDLAKFDRILTQFGYRITEPIKTSFLNNRPKFNYIEASGVSIKSTGQNVSKAIRDDVARMFDTGLRIWHVKPDESYYTNGNIN